MLYVYQSPMKRIVDGTAMKLRNDSAERVEYQRGGWVRDKHGALAGTPLAGVHTSSSRSRVSTPPCVSDDAL